VEEEITLLAASISALINRIDNLSYVSSIIKNDDKLEVVYSNQFKQKFSLSANKELEIDFDSIKDSIISLTNKNISNSNQKVLDLIGNLETKFNSDIENKSSHIIEIIKDSYDKTIAELEPLLIEKTKNITQELLQIIDSSEKKVDVSIIDENQIIETLTKDLDNKIKDISIFYNEEFKKSLDYTIQNIKIPENGKDANEDNIIAVIKDYFIDFFKEERVAIEGKLNNIITEQEKKLLNFIKDEVTSVIGSIEKPKDGVDGQDGEDGKNGVDANVEEVVELVLLDVNKKIDKNNIDNLDFLKRLVQESIQEVQKSLVIPVAKDGMNGKDGERGAKGRKGDKGDDGVGIKSVEINYRGHLIVETTERKKIDAGEVTITKIVGGGGGSGGESGDFKYTNELPMVFDVGGYPKGTQFLNVDQRVLWTKLLYGLDLPEFTQFIIQSFPQELEIGYSWGNFPNTVLFNIQNAELLKENSIIIRQNGIDLLTGGGNISPVAVNIEAYTQEVVGTINFEILAYDTTGVSFNMYYPVHFYYKIYYGEYQSELPPIGSSDNTLDILRADRLADDIIGEYDFLGGEYSWFCYPAILGENYLFLEKSSDIGMVFDDVQQRMIINDNGLPILYNCYRSLNEINGEFIMEVRRG